VHTICRNDQYSRLNFTELCGDVAQLYLSQTTHHILKIGYLKIGYLKIGYLKIGYASG